MKVLSIGRFDNELQEQALGLPIIRAIEARGIHVVRIGRQFDFFNPKNHDRQVADWVSGVPQSLAGFDALLLMDWWSPILPLLTYRMSVLESAPKLIGLFLGATVLEGDLAREIPFAREYEDYLYSVFDLIICPVEWVGRLLPAQARVEVRAFPIDSSGMLPVAPQRDRVLYLQRWAYDKAPERFQEFAQLAAPSGIECWANADPVYSNGPDDPIRYIGWQSEAQLKKLGQKGGYIWGHARQEIFGYAISNMIRFGLTPLVSADQGYDALNLPDRFRFNSIRQAEAKVAGCLWMSDDDRHEWISQHRHNADRIAESVEAVIHAHADQAQQPY